VRPAMAPVQIDGADSRDTAQSPMADRQRRCCPGGIFGQTKGMRDGDGEFRAMSTCVGFLPQAEHVSLSITSATC
jgi:hypothetical protein